MAGSIGARRVGRLFANNANRKRHLENPPESCRKRVRSEIPEAILEKIWQGAFGKTLREQQKEEIIRSEIEDGIKRLGKRAPVLLSTMSGPNIHILYAGPRTDFAKKVNDRVVGTCCLNGRQACEELRLNLLGDNPNAPFPIEAPYGERELFQYRIRWRRFCYFTRKYFPNPDKYSHDLLTGRYPLDLLAHFKRTRYYDSGRWHFKKIAG